MSRDRKIAEVFEDLATEIDDELLQETFVDLNPDVKRLGNIDQKNSNFEQKRRAEEG